ncbi:PDR/VanB family oxidoreductase [Paraburkholderia oxyphila]|uniref:PDR/VanB family oxidoreductase n=1 Tax=Paraburkholderia oxyphila TaxID=614212 RepID=UPI00047F3A5F|nr:PDR/VanB family oxidoreductase [Paraburkholderia oxyphila]
MESAGTLEVEVRAMRVEAETVRSFELWPVAGELPPFGAGAHIDVHLPNGIVRQYSLTNPQERHCYVIGVNRDAASRGGSVHMHDALALGSRLTISTPRNHFPLDEAAGHSVLVAGGIGITPLLAMARRLTAVGRRWDLYYCARTARRAAFLPELRALADAHSGGTLHCVFDGEPGGAPLDLGSVLARHGAEADYYCCGPTALMDAFTAALASVPPVRVHTEYFKAPEPSSAAHGEAFTVRLERQQKSFVVPPERSILDVLEAHGVPVMCSCREGVCGTCETAVIAGEPDHRDHVLSPDERAANRTMMICVSRCKGDWLALDI